MPVLDDKPDSPNNQIDLAATVDDAPVLIWVSGPDKAGVYFNRTWLEFTGRTLEQEAGQGWLEGVHPDDLPALEICDDAFTRRQPFQVEFRLRRSDGAWRWLLDRAEPRFAPDGAFLGFVGSCIDITERKEAEAALRRSEERLQIGQEASAVGTYDWDVQSGRITWSPEMFRLHGIDPQTPEDAIYPAWLDRLHPDDRERADAETRRFVETPDRLDIEFRIVHPQAGLRWIQGRGRMIHDAEGRPLRMIGVNFDITERRMAEEALRESEQRLRDIAEHFPGVIFRRITYPDGRIEYPYFSGADEHVFGVSRERIDTIVTMEDVARLIHYEDFDEMLAKFRHAAETLTPLEVEGRIFTESGETVWLRSISRPRPRGDGALIWDGVMLNVTEQHRQQGERERAATMLRMGMEVAGIGTWELDPQGETISGSSITNEIFNLPADAAARPVDDYIRAVHPDDAEWVRDGLLEAARSKQNTFREYRVVAADGSLRWIVSRGSFARLADGSERLIGALYDVTDRKHREQEREMALERQRMLLQELNHRVKNNLQMVTSVLQLQATRAANEETRDSLDRAINRIGTIADLHAQFKLEAEFGRIDFADYLQQVCAKLRTSLLAESGIELRCNAERCEIDLDKAVPLGLIVNELVTNAIKHAFEAAPGVVTIDFRRGAAGELLLEVRDDGRGFSDRAPESGLGMQLVNGLCRQLGGTLEVGSEGGVRCLITVLEDVSVR